MKNVILRILFFSTILFLWSQNSLAQSGLNSSAVKRTTATVLFTSIGGGVLGLSTLSFYGKPQEHTDNITIGVLLGLITGVGYVVYDNNRQPTAMVTLWQHNW
jgi:hypothetical protein